VSSVTGQHTATNYRSEAAKSQTRLGGDRDVEVYRNSPQGPFWLSNSNERPQSGYLLTKTHCGGGSSSINIKVAAAFSERCASDNGGENKEKTYSNNLVARAVHLIRDPFDNIVSRFHLQQKKMIKKNQTEKVEMYPLSKEGFRKFCNSRNETKFRTEEASKFYHGISHQVKNVPCYEDFGHYIQWHNLAFATTKELGLPTMIIHYENYTDNFNQTKDSLLEFLGSTGINEPSPFVTGKSYREYYTDKEIQAVDDMFSKLALDKTLEHTKHYLVPL